MSVERGAESLLVKVVTNESNRTTEDEETVEGTNLIVKEFSPGATQHAHPITHFNILLSFLRVECTTITEQINEADGDATIDVQDEL